MIKRPPKINSIKEEKSLEISPRNNKKTAVFFHFLWRCIKVLFRIIWKTIIIIRNSIEAFSDGLFQLRHTRYVNKLSFKFGWWIGKTIGMLYRNIKEVFIFIIYCIVLNSLIDHIKNKKK